MSTPFPHLNYTVSLSKLTRIQYLWSTCIPDGIQRFGSRHNIQRLCQTHYNNYTATCTRKKTTSVSSIQIFTQNLTLSSSTILPTKPQKLPRLKTFNLNHLQEQ
jgi:hypothetical protein